MDAAWATAVAAIALTVLFGVIWGWRVLNWLWLRPKKLERLLREQGLQGNPYRIFGGDLKDLRKMQMEANSRPMNLSDDLVLRVQPYVQQSVTKYGKNSFIWSGPRPRVIITDPELIKDVFDRNYDFPKPDTNPLAMLLAGVLQSLRVRSGANIEG